MIKGSPLLLIYTYFELSSARSNNDLTRLTLKGCRHSSEYKTKVHIM